MSELVDSATRTDKPDDRRIYGVVLAQVIDICDNSKLGRVQLRLPWLPGYEPWARVASLAAGSDSGMYFIPQKDEEVLVAFNHGDVREPYVVGCVWNDKDKAPKEAAKDPKNKRSIRTPAGHEIEFDDATGTIVIKSAKGQRVVLGPDNIEIDLDEKKTTAITLEKGGNLTIKASNTITLDAPTINVTARDNVAIGGSKSARIDGGSYCSINAGQIFIG